MSLGYMWLFTKDGKAENRMVMDYEAERAKGWSRFEDCRDLGEAKEETPEPMQNDLTCPKCGKLCANKTGLASHIRNCKG